MLKKIGLSGLLLAGLMAFAAPRPAQAEVHFGVYVGVPAYSSPSYGGYGYDPYASSYGYDYGYPAPVYQYRAPAYVTPYSYAPSYRNQWGNRDWDRHDRDRDRHE